MEEVTVRLPISAHYDGSTGKATYEYADIPIKVFGEWCADYLEKLELLGHKVKRTSGEEEY